jgi:ribonuclease J
LPAVESSLRLVALGGLGEIGMNCMVLEANGDLMVIDCGVTFPDDLGGVDVIHPDFTFLSKRRDRLAGIVITHGHEDHIGALPYLLRAAPAPIHAPPYAIELIKRRLAEHDDLPAVHIHPTRPGTRFRVGTIGVEPVRVTHSIVDATALILDTPAGVVIHTGDFKIDPDPIDGEHFDHDRLRAAGDAGVRLLLSDSTNAWVAGTTGSERSAADALDASISEASGRVVVALFASNNHRVRSLLQIARAHGRRVLLLGRSLHRHFEAARESGYLPDPGSLLVGERDARDLPRDQLLILATGTQGEPRAALARLAEDRHPALGLEPGDVTLLSSRIIPGNERRVYALINSLIRQGVAVHWSATDPGIHVSGHAHADEQRRMLRLVRPASFVPVHGTRMHLERHAALAAAEGVEETLVVENGGVVEVTPDTLRVVESVPVGRVAVDRLRELPSEVLAERATLGDLGCAFAIVPTDGRGLTGPISVVSRGVLGDGDADETEESAEHYVEDALEDRRVDFGDPEAVREEARRALGRFLKKKLGRKPLTWAVVARTFREDGQ